MDFAREPQKYLEHEIDGDTKCSWNTWKRSLRAWRKTLELRTENQLKLEKNGRI